MLDALKFFVDSCKHLFLSFTIIVKNGEISDSRHRWKRDTLSQEQEMQKTQNTFRRKNSYKKLKNYS